jgi:hypothetical protein
MKKREDNRFANGQMRFIRGLLDSYIERDSWTRLNVKPSKIMQQEEVLCELFDHGNSNNIDSNATMETYTYLKACSDLFENGLLSKTPIYDMESPVIKNIRRGFEYFENWCNEVYDKHCNDPVAKTKHFLAWQTWDLLRICVYGAQSLIHDFVSRNPGYFVVLSRINGSVVESLFSQLKYAASGKLSSVNYSTARRAVMTSKNVHGELPSNSDYRNENLDLAD